MKHVKPRSRTHRSKVTVFRCDIGSTAAGAKRYTISPFVQRFIGLIWMPTWASFWSSSAMTRALFWTPFTEKLPLGCRCISCYIFCVSESFFSLVLLVVRNAAAKLQYSHMRLLWRQHTGWSCLLLTKWRKRDLNKASSALSLSLYFSIPFAGQRDTTTGALNMLCIFAHSLDHPSHILTHNREQFVHVIVR